MKHPTRRNAARVEVKAFTLINGANNFRSMAAAAHFHLSPLPPPPVNNHVTAKCRPNVCLANDKKAVKSSPFHIKFNAQCEGRIFHSWKSFSSCIVASWKYTLQNESSLLRWKYLAQYWSEKVLSRHNSELSSLHCNYLEEKEKIWSISFNSFESFDFNFAHAHVSFEEYMMKPQDDLFKRLSPSASFIACNTKVFDIQRPRREYT